MAKTAFVTGVSKGIGRALVELLLSNGWEVFGVSRSNPQLESELFHWIEFDLMNFQEYQKLNDLLPEKLDLLVNNAGISYTVPIENVIFLDVEKQFKINVEAPILLMSQMHSKLSSGMVVNISSVFAKVPHQGLAVYSATKSALNEFTRGFALDSGIPSFSLMPSMVDSPIAHTIYGKDFDNSKLLQPADIAEAVLKVTESGFASGTEVLVLKQGEEFDTAMLNSQLQVIKV